MAVQNYNMPVILPDLRREESYHQIVDALEYLDAVANDVFSRISCRYTLTPVHTLKGCSSLWNFSTVDR